MTYNVLMGTLNATHSLTSYLSVKSVVIVTVGQDNVLVLQLQITSVTVTSLAY